MRLTRHTDNALRALIFLAIHPDEPARIADISRRMHMSEDHLAKVVARLAQLGYVETLSRAETRDVPPTAHVIPLATPMRQDVPVAPIDPELAVANAPQRAGSAFVVPRVIEGGDS